MSRLLRGRWPFGQLYSVSAELSIAKMDIDVAVGVG